MITKGAYIVVVLVTVMLSFVLNAKAQVTVIAHESVPVDSLDKSDLLKLFSGTTEYWENQIPVTIVDLALEGEVRDAFYSYLGRPSSRMRSIWLKRKLTGEGELPQSMGSEEELLKLVSSTEGAIGFVSSAHAEDYPTIKVLIPDIPLVVHN